MQVALANPHIAGIGFDLAEVAPTFEEYVADNGLSSRVAFLREVSSTTALPKADVVMMGHILHDWNLEEKKMLIAKGLGRAPRRRRVDRL